MKTQTKQTIYNSQLLYKLLVLTQLYRQLHPGIQTYIINNEGAIEDVEDIMQEAFLQLLDKLKNEKLSIHTGVHNYLFGISKNLWRAELRHRKKLCHSPRYFEVGDNLDDLDIMFQNNQDSIFKKHYSKLGAITQNIWKLCFEGRNTKEIADLTGYSEGYLRKKKCKSKKRLLQMVQQDPMYMECVA